MSLDALGSDVARHASSLAASSQRVTQIRATGWVGQAADAFAADIAPLPGDLGRSAEVFGMVASTLGIYASELGSAQRRVDILEQRAAQARSARQLATARVEVLGHGPPGETDPARQARESDLRAARLRVEDADAELAAILRAAHGLEEHVFGVAEQTSRLIRAAAERAPDRRPHLLQQGLDLLQRGWQSTKEWAREHADVLRTVSSGLKLIAAAAAVVALAVQVVPVLGQIVGTIPLAVAAAAGAGALGIDVLLKLSTGEGSWAMLGLDIALTVIPGAALLRAGKGLLRPAGHALGAPARTPFVANVLRPATVTIERTRRALPGIARTVRQELTSLGRRLVTDERGSIGRHPGDANPAPRTAETTGQTPSHTPEQKNLAQAARPGEALREGGAVLRFESKTAARGGLTGDAGKAANRFFRDATSKSQDFQIQELSGGRYRLQFFSPANNPGYGKLYVQDIDSAGNVLREFKNTMGPDGLIETKWVHGGP